MNENYTTSSVSSSTQLLDISDVSPTTTFKDYSFKISGSLVTNSPLYGFDMVDIVQFQLKDNTQGQENDNNILINPEFIASNNLVKI